MSSNSGDIDWEEFDKWGDDSSHTSIPSDHSSLPNNQNNSSQMSDDFSSESDSNQIIDPFDQIAHSIETTSQSHDETTDSLSLDYYPSLSSYTQNDPIVPSMSSQSDFHHPPEESSYEPDHINGPESHQLIDNEDPNSQTDITPLSNSSTHSLSSQLDPPHQSLPSPDFVKPSPPSIESSSLPDTKPNPFSSQSQKSTSNPFVSSLSKNERQNHPLIPVVKAPNSASSSVNSSLSTTPFSPDRTSEFFSYFKSQLSSSEPQPTPCYSIMPFKARSTLINKRQKNAPLYLKLAYTIVSLTYLIIVIDHLIFYISLFLWPCFLFSFFYLIHCFSISHC
jgi:hypothetical protein